MTTIEFQYQLENLQEPLTRFAYSLTANNDVAKDLLKETLLKASTYKNKFSYESNIKAWTYTIMKNTFINNYIRFKRHNIYDNTNNERIYQNYLSTLNADDPHSTYYLNEVEKIIAALYNDLKLPFIMYNDGFKYKEIAKILDLKLGTVKNRIFFARNKLIKQLNQYNILIHDRYLYH
jgi:RNA polymerase sigma factor (sigma-70 family)